MSHSERQLIDRLKKGTQESFTMLVEQYGRKIYGLAFRMCGNREDAEDIVQETFIRALKNICGFKEESSLYTWLYAITRNLCLRRLENRRKDSFASLERLAQTVQEPPDNYSAFQKRHYIQQVKDGCLLGLLRCIPFYQRMAFILNVLLEVKAKDVSIILNKSETATRLLVHRARKNIRNYLCRNCSLYKHDNSCHCENMINFSLKQGWIQEAQGNTSLQPILRDIEQEIDGLKKITLLYQSVQDNADLENVIRLIQNKINGQTYKEFFS